MTDFEVLFLGPGNQNEWRAFEDKYIRWGVENTGTEPLTVCTGLFLSEDTDLTTDDLVLRQNSIGLGVGDLGGFRDIFQEVPFQVKPDWPADDYYIGVIAFEEIPDHTSSDPIPAENAEVLTSDLYQISIFDEGETVLGTQGNDRLSGSSFLPDTVWGFEGDDTLSGFHGDDLVYGGAGNDRLTGGATLYGGTGDDTLLGSFRAEELYGEAGDDYIDGGANRGFVRDTLDGGDGNDTLYGGAGFDLLLGGADADLLYGGEQADHLFGGDGDDTLYGEGGMDRLFGEAGNDLIIDTAGADVLFGGAGDDTLRGGDDADVLWGGTGNDILDGQAGNDRVYGGDGDDYLSSRSGSAVLFGEAGSDLFQLGDGHARVFGGLGNDIINTGLGTSVIYGNAGFDQIVDLGGDGLVFGDFNADEFFFLPGHGNDTIGDFEANNPHERLNLRFFNLEGIDDLALDDPDAGPAQQIGDDVLIQLEPGSSILLLDVDLHDLDAADFLL